MPLSVQNNNLNTSHLSIKATIDYGKALLSSRSDSAKLDSQLLLACVLDKARSYLFTWPDKILTQQELEGFKALVIRRVAGEPIAYILGIKEFWSLPFKVSPATLIPRPDTETLVELVLELYARESELCCLDLGTGTGAIAISLASELPSWQIDAVDFNQEAVILAKKNAEELQQSQVNIYQSDWFNAVAKNKKFDVIVSNPPYIDADDVNLLQGDVRFEPRTALVANEKGLADIKHIASVARNYLTSQGTIFFEHGFEQALSVRQALMELGYQKIKTVKDLNNQDRITWALYN